jgi:Ca2+-dependent lipid-binding protein
MGVIPGLPPPDTLKPETRENGIVTTGAPPPPVGPALVSKAGWRENGGIDEDDEELHQDWLSMRLGDKYFGSWWHNAGIIFFCCFVCWVLGRFGAGFTWIVFILAISSTYYRTSIKRVRNRVRDDLNREHAKQRLETDFETTEWLNTFLLKFWIIYEPVLSATIIASVDQVLSTQTPAFLDSLRLSKFTLGTKPPRVEQVKTYPKSEEDIVLMDWQFSFTPNDVSDLTARQLKNKVNPKVVLAIRVGKGLVGKDLPILVEDMSFSGLMRIKIKLMSQFPHVKTVDLSFLERPNFDYVLKPIGGETFGFDIGNVLDPS